MDPDRQRLKAVALVVVIVVLLTGLLAYGVMHKINQKILKPGADMQSETISTQKAN